MSGPILIPILGDQLSLNLASLCGQVKADCVLLLMEVQEEATYVRHHPQKIALILSAMRHFAAELADDGWRVDYVQLDDPANSGSFSGEIRRAVQRHGAQAVRLVEPGEVRVLEALEALRAVLPCPLEIVPDSRFLCSIDQFRNWARGRKNLRMEYFYRAMRRQTGLLMNGDEPEGGQWNYDLENRAPPDARIAPPPAPRFAPDAITRDVLGLVRERFSGHFGRLDGFAWPVTRQEAEQARAAFLKDRLPQFGTWQDAMLAGQEQMYHSLLSAAINLGLLDVLETCRLAQAEYRAGRAPLNAVEGFIRQLIGWREYVRGMYWLDPHGMARTNALAAQRPLPDFFWTGDTRMACLADCIRTSRDNAYAHHIQRLMVLGNFALLAGIEPRAVQDWFLIAYADAFEWVELPNVAGMALWADGGKLASKPYAASGNYIGRMSNYCGQCHYAVRQKTGPQACPFNPLYWHFLHRNRSVLEANPRIARAYATWDRMSAEKQRDYLGSADDFLDSLEPARSGWAKAD